LHAPHDQLVLAGEIVLGQHAACRMVLSDVEGGNHLALFGALAHQRRVAAGAERQRESRRAGSITGAGLASERGETEPKSISSGRSERCRGLRAVA